MIGIWVFQFVFFQNWFTPSTLHFGFLATGNIADDICQTTKILSYYRGRKSFRKVSYY